MRNWHAAVTTGHYPLGIRVAMLILSNIADGVLSCLVAWEQAGLKSLASPAQPTGILCISLIRADVALLILVSTAHDKAIPIPMLARDMRTCRDGLGAGRTRCSTACTSGNPNAAGWLSRSGLTNCSSFWKVGRRRR